MTPGLGLKNWDMGMTNRRKRPRDFSQAAKLVIDIATGQVEDRPPTPEEQGMRSDMAASLPNEPDDLLITDELHHRIAHKADYRRAGDNRARSVCRPRSQDDPGRFRAAGQQGAPEPCITPARSKRPRRHRAAEKGYELAPSYIE
jgi:hypothetical protein